MVSLDVGVIVHRSDAWTVSVKSLTATGATYQVFLRNKVLQGEVLHTLDLP